MNETLSRLVDSGVVAVLRGVPADQLIEIAEALREGGVTAVEITADTPNVADLIDEVTASFDDEVVVGTGTVLDSETARTTLMAGAEFVVSPSLHEDVIETCNRYGAVSAPGVMTPTEAVRGYEAGADFVKVFPAKTVGPAHLGAMKGPLGQIPMMPTGGVSPDNAAEYVEAGAFAVGAGGALVDYDAAERGDYEVITETAREFTRVVEEARGD
ncbi:bifunctional 4-hydroxy-2-oxoglutarate aldolase/2-dehydro-3-deoxy-phosphogluconate aldolase [Halorubrum ezzemoulense]|jgi:2-dehydro-3-deoxyphosphogluconate aldolase/(4S)-4-hydroxy-2-oxoglutarate aldolase|uniref:2-dehydro-3-deoxyphosphogluconate aldolase n=2 Tax=Halorubrum ezzemoulense TaxID=337243 RepID=A0A256K8Y0_HALEZ|nr:MULTISPECIES: bifunctional 4-hydroxy-2-oxoglutarate aldolase/2-dehydro-3-deoxy-phosphogluconate aldolase [Halorubrum]MDB2238482.1 bifunctional 4-hydroxy-2-oxoglutarate aldolase/2-dehydro-3-deoxy-phosphogluconate aldolase [Halorubrum ezzemoulense]MDB2242151.1 bifunctional 4-hydroxy-2-oxoglutarate aldolase/2-dehydro-3-deoxy-phosphogluconate aldolase [Halorubrum ezzemoulense]MDB2245934.1 bifunctional 4-hydroxy-2-oxoglutarate aldolase/2-dehydro-3-deoxy-phosphogluconate aldolase [Halorubrum ezzemo